jgi:hypothetical protein
VARGAISGRAPCLILQSATFFHSLDHSLPGTLACRSEQVPATPTTTPTCPLPISTADLVTDVSASLLMI